MYSNIVLIQKNLFYYKINLEVDENWNIDFFKYPTLSKIMISCSWLHCWEPYEEVGRLDKRYFNCKIGSHLQISIIQYLVDDSWDKKLCPPESL